MPERRTVEPRSVSVSRAAVCGMLYHSWVLTDPQQQQQQQQQQPRPGSQRTTCKPCRSASTALTPCFLSDSPVSGPGAFSWTEPAESQPTRSLELTSTFKVQMQEVWEQMVPMSTNSKP
ncbi:hypothetical protein AAFF_G00212780 [Aldrovandia affinis]|uniref:Uncharacterized protein n=1 Tax=Aldrovandia affinis TaxID=143900 RepID=A0AAD7RH14_9TELE|nr:hypothetical protein AAFF_G00212780 [Aldrovandia affinis]